MSAVPIFDHHKGCHCADRRPSFFRRLVRPWWRKAAPAGVAAGAATTLIADRWACCVHCVTEDVNECDPRDDHRAPCKDGCNDPRPYDERHCAVPSAHGMTDPYYCTLPAHHVWAPLADRLAAASPEPTFTPRADTEPAGFPALTPAQQAAHADAMHGLSARYLPAPPRPVNGRSLGTLPRKQAPHHPPWQTAGFPAVTDDVPGPATLIEQFAAEQVRVEYIRSQMQEGMAARDPETLRQVLDGLRNLPVYGEAPQLEVAEAERLARVMQR